jgi:hypothetical protein
MLAEKDGEADKFRIFRRLPGQSVVYEPFGNEGFEKKTGRLGFSFDFAKINEFKDFDCIAVCAFGRIIAFSEHDFTLLKIDEGDPFEEGLIPSGICAFGNRLVATFEGSDSYWWSGIARADFLIDGGAGYAASEYANDMTRAVRRTGSRLAVFTTTAIEIKDLSQDPDLPFQGYLYQNNYDIGALADTIRSIDGALYFVGQERSGLRFIYSLENGTPKKLTNENQASLLSGAFHGSGAMQEGGHTFYCANGERRFGIDILNGSLFEMDSELEHLDYIRSGNDILRVCKSGLYMAEPGSDDYVLGKARLPKFDFGGAASLLKMSFVGEFLESGPALASLSAGRGFFQQAAAHGRGFDFFLVGMRKLNDLEFSAGGNFRLTRIEIEYNLLKNGSYYGAGG